MQFIKLKPAKMLLNLVIFSSLLSVCFSTGKVRSRTQVTSQDGELIEVTETTISSKCYQYTWLGPVNRKTNQTERCSDLEVDSEDDVEERPCWPPLVWTTNDENQLNRPSAQDIVEACEALTPKCDPTCIPTGGQTCVKYTLMSNNADKEVIRETSYCGRVVIDGKTTDKDVCRKQIGATGGYNLEVCSCSEKSLCNSAFTHNNSLTLLAIVLFYLCW